MIARYSSDDVRAGIDTLDRGEPDQARGGWGEPYDRLHDALLDARKTRRYCAIPAMLIAAALVILFHGRVWDFEDIRNLFVIELGAVLLLNFLLTKVFPVLAREDRVQTLLRYYGAQDVPHEEEAIQ
ncbi:hypothetical protein [Candidatus Viadribacter manganicus]|uniref:Uncharacterized protein n=1 Tax=Candidatus Viadribacter manganicus TaxID=1759059 RepID=A0A1B1AE76_9PROT|nr:hypothetical protein [Candidatus Viadribacter manganicus]ANP44864.1 hypothetical protein ATE48_02455 [Candidatus Viadribacter manganicus]